MAEKVFFFDLAGDTRKVIYTDDEIQSVDDLVLMANVKYSDVGLDTNGVKFWTKDQTYGVRHKIERATDLYEGAVLEVVPGSDQKRKREDDKQVIASKKARFTAGPRFVLRLRGLPWHTSKDHIKNFFNGIELLEAKVCYLPNGRGTGHGLVEFHNEEDMQRGLLKNKENMGKRYIEVYKASAEDMDRALGVASTNDIMDDRNKVVRMRGLPYSATRNDILEFFKVGNLNPARVHMITNRGNGRASGIALVEFQTEQEITAAMDLNRNEIGGRWIELFKGTMGELRGALGDDSLQTGGNQTGGNHRGAGAFTRAGFDERRAAQGGGGGHGSACIRMRGLPFQTNDTDITNFFRDAGVTPTRIHRKADGSEAYVEFHPDDVDSAMTRQKSYMGHRYVDLYRISYEEVADIIGLPVSKPYRAFY